MTTEHHDVPEQCKGRLGDPCISQRRFTGFATHVGVVPITRAWLFELRHSDADYVCLSTHLDSPRLLQEPWIADAATYGAICLASFLEHGAPTGIV